MSFPQVSNKKFDTFNTAISRLVGHAHAACSIESEVERARAAEAAIMARLDALDPTAAAEESARARAAEAAIMARLDAFAPALPALPADIDAKLAALTARIDALALTDVDAKLAAFGDAMRAESERARTAESTIFTRLDSLVRAAPVWTVSVSAETDRAKAAEADLSAQIEAETARARQAEADLSARLSTTKTVATMSASGTLGNEQLVHAHAGGGAVTLTLPLSSRYPGRSYYVFRTDASEHAVTIRPAGGDTLAGTGTATVVLASQDAFTHIISTGVRGWFVVAGAVARV